MSNLCGANVAQLFYLHRHVSMWSDYMRLRGNLISVISKCTILNVCNFTVISWLNYYSILHGIVNVYQHDCILVNNY